jgi:hypothetical protein
MALALSYIKQWIKFKADQLVKAMLAQSNRLRIWRWRYANRNSSMMPTTNRRKTKNRPDSEQDSFPPKQHILDGSRLCPERCSHCKCKWYFPLPLTTLVVIRHLEISSVSFSVPAPFRYQLYQRSVPCDSQGIFLRRRRPHPDWKQLQTTELCLILDGWLVFL